MEQLAVQNYSAFIGSAEVTQGVKQVWAVAVGLGGPRLVSDWQLDNHDDLQPSDSKSLFGFQALSWYNASSCR